MVMFNGRSQNSRKFSDQLLRVGTRWLGDTMASGPGSRGGPGGSLLLRTLQGHCPVAFALVSPLSAHAVDLPRLPSAGHPPPIAPGAFPAYLRAGLTLGPTALWKAPQQSGSSPCPPAQTVVITPMPCSAPSRVHVACPPPRRLPALAPIFSLTPRSALTFSLP